MPAIGKELERRLAALQVAVARVHVSPDVVRDAVAAEIRAERETIALMAALQEATRPRSAMEPS
jgi:hypothetical protein